MTQILADVFAPQLPVPAQSTWTHTLAIVSAGKITNGVGMATGGIQMSVVASARRISCIVGGRKLQTLLLADVCALKRPVSVQR